MKLFDEATIVPQNTDKWWSGTWPTDDTEYALNERDGAAAELPTRQKHI